MKKLIAMAMMTMACAVGVAQVKVAPAKAPVPLPPQKLSYLETVGLQSTFDKLQANERERTALMEQLRRDQADVVAAHPGYHLDIPTGTLVKDEATEKEKTTK